MNGEKDRVMQMRILIDTTPLENANAIRGVGRYTQELIQALRLLSTPHEFVTSKEVGKSSIDLVHYPFFDLFFSTLPLRHSKPTVVTIHDVIPLVFAKHYPRGIKGNVKFFKQRLALRGVSHVITDSQISKRDIIEHLKIQSEKITVVPLAASGEIRKPPQAIVDSVRKQHELPKKYALYVGDINYNKNLPFLISAMSRVEKLALVLVGKNVKDTTISEGREIDRAVKAHGMEKRVYFVDNLGTNSVQELSALYAGATVYIQPSLYEGFGLPILEAMQCRTPVVCSLGGSLPEVAGDAAVYFHPHDEEECATAIMKVLHMPERQLQGLIQKGVDQASRYTWEQTAKQTLAVYEMVMRK
ncbi:MAG: glycosyltransferase family 1 protein [Candidatus Woesebacteria bacterium]